MNYLDKTKVTVELAEQGIEKPTKVHFQNVVPNVEEDKILALGDIMTRIAPRDTELDRVVKIEETVYHK